jgi:chromate transporter
MLPGFVLMFGLSWFYVKYGINSGIFQAVFLGMQPAVAAQIIRAVQRIGIHALHRDLWLWGIAIVSGMAHWLQINFLLILLFGGVEYALIKRGFVRVALWISVLFAGWLWIVHMGLNPVVNIPAVNIEPNPSGGEPSALRLLVTGLRSGLLTFGGAYTAIQFMQHDAVITGGWMTNAQFLDGLALSGLLPAPLIIFSTFVGYLGGGALGALLVTFGVFAPAFAFTMIGHEYLQRLVDNRSIHSFLDGITASVTGLIAITALGFLTEALNGITAWLIFALALIGLYKLKSKWAVVAIILGAGAVGLAIQVI